MSVLAGLKPERVFYYFEELCRIPHGSGNTKEVSDYLVQFARDHELSWYQDASNNVSSAARHRRDVNWLRP